MRVLCKPVPEFKNTIPRTRAFTYVQIKFVLYKADGEEYSISQLSGGQKTLVGLAFLCALACYRKFPFYLLGKLTITSL